MTIIGGPRQTLEEMQAEYEQAHVLKRRWWRLQGQAREAASWRTWRRAVLFAWQRLNRGWDESDWWSLDHTIATFVLPRLIEFRAKTHSFPAQEGANSPEEWDAILGEIIFAMETAANGDYGWESPEIRERVEAGLALFGKWFPAFWD